MQYVHAFWKLELCDSEVVKYKVTINNDFIPNWFFDKYGVDIKLNYSDLATLSHGEDNSYEVWLKPGKHTLKFKKTVLAS